MSLKLWLPLDGSLRNLGSWQEKLTLTNTTSNITWQDGGILGGKAGYFAYDSSTPIGLISNKIIMTNNFSFSFWINMTETDVTNQDGYVCGFGYGDSGAHGIYMYIIGGKMRIYYENSSTGAPVYKTFGNFPHSDWYHIVLIYDGSYIRVYIDGQAFNSVSCTYDHSSIEARVCLNCRVHTFNTGVVRYASGNKLVNDFRYYDHTLSLAEIKHLYQLLILHYKFNGNDCIIDPGGTTNSIATIKNAAGATYGTSIYPTSLLNENVLSLDSVFSVDFDYAKSVVGLNNYVQETSTILKHRNEVSSGSLPAESLSGHALLTGHVHSGTTSTVRIRPVIAKNTGAVGDTFSVTNLKFLLGDLKSIYGVVDESGYGDNGTITGAIKLVEDSARYTLSSQLDPAFKITCDRAIKPQKFTIHGWVKLNSADETVSCFLMNCSGGWSVRVHSNNRFYVHINGANFANCVISDATQWHAYCVTYDGVNLKQYIDGVQKKSTAVSSDKIPVYTNNAAVIGNMTAGTAWVSDLRLYGTVLTNDDIIDLYKTSLYINNTQGLETFQLKESVKTQQISQRGVLLTEQFVEGEYVDSNETIQPITNVLIKADSILATEFIER